MADVVAWPWPRTVGPVDSETTDLVASAVTRSRVVTADRSTVWAMAIG